MTKSPFILLIALSFLGCKTESSKEERNISPQKESNAISEIESSSPNKQEVFFMKNLKGATIQKNDLRNPGLIAKKMGFSVRYVGGAYDADYHFDSKDRTQMILSDSEEGVFLRILGDELSISKGVKVGMDFATLRKSEPKLKCETTADADGSDVRCYVSSFVAIFPATFKEIENLSSPAKLDELEKMLGETKLARLIIETDDIPKPKSSTPLVRQKGVLPAGVSYFRNAYTPCKNTRWSAKNCDIPTVAVVDGVYSESNARERLNSIGVGAQYPVGYPLVVHSDEIGFKDTQAKGVAIVLGLFANGNAAKKWQLKTAPRAEVMTLLPPGELPSAYTKQVIRIRPGASAQGYKDRPFKKTEKMINPPDKMPEGFCKVAAGSFVVSSKRFLYMESPIPATCKDGQKAFVHYNDTLLHTMIGPNRKSKWKIWQLSFVECDTGNFSSWPMEGRQVGSKRKVLINDGGC